MEIIHHHLLVKLAKAVEDEDGSEIHSNLVPKHQIFSCKIEKENLVYIFSIFVPRRNPGIVDAVNKGINIKERKGLGPMDGYFGFNNVIIPQRKEN